MNLGYPILVHQKGRVFYGVLMAETSRIERTVDGNKTTTRYTVSILEESVQVEREFHEEDIQEITHYNTSARAEFLEAKANYAWAKQQADIFNERIPLPVAVPVAPITQIGTDDENKF